MSKHFDVQRDAHGNIVLITITHEAPGKRTQKMKLTGDEIDLLLRNIHPSLVLALRTSV